MPAIDPGRRNAMKLVGAAAIAGTLPMTVRAADADPDEFAQWFADVDNYEGVVDATGGSSVDVAVGAAGNGGAFGFSPAAVRVDPGTTVTWTWTGEGGVHDVKERDGEFASEMLGDAGETFEHTFDTEGVYYYVCSPHEAMGMKGAVVVGDVDVVADTADAGDAAPSSQYDEPYYGDWFDDVPNFRGTVDATGQDEVTVTVGEEADGTYVFEPAAVRVDPGTTVVWEWVGDGTHDLVADDESWGTDALAAGSSFALRFDGDGVARYLCSGHDRMKGAIVVGAGGRTVETLSPLGLGVGGGIVAVVLGGLGFGLYHHVKDTTQQEAWTPRNGR